MLACFVSAIPRRGAAVEVAIVEEAAAADDVPSLAGFALLVNEPAAASDVLSAFAGSILIEAGSASDTVNAGSIYAVISNEPASAAEAYLAETGVQYMVEAASAADAPDATKITALVARSVMFNGVFINSDGTARQVNANGVMGNL